LSRGEILDVHRFDVMRMSNTMIDFEASGWIAAFEVCNVSVVMNQEFPTFLWPWTPSAFRQMSM